MRGGLTSGARERVATAGARGYLDMSQDAARQGAMARGRISMEDEKNRQEMLRALPGAEMQQADMMMRRADALTRAEQDDLNRQIAETERRNQYNMQTFGIQGQMFGAEKTAQAQEKANEDSWVCTALSKRGHITPPELIRALRKHAWREQPELTRLYLTRGNHLVERMLKSEFDWARLAPFHRELQGLLASGKTDRALQLFISTVRALWDEFWPDCDSALYRAVKGVV